MSRIAALIAAIAPLGALAQQPGAAPAAGGSSWETTPPPQSASPTPPPQQAPAPAPAAPAYPPPQAMPAPAYPPAAYPPPVFPAARPQRRGAWYIGFGLGSGAGNIDGAGTSTSLSNWVGGGATTLSLNFRVGATLTPNLLLGFDGGALATQNSSNSVQLNYYDVGMMFFPVEKGFFLRAAAGLSAAVLDGGIYVTGKGTVRGGNVLAGLGYAFWLGETFNLTLNLDYQAHFFGSNTIDLKSAGGVSGWVGFDWY